MRRMCFRGLNLREKNQIIKAASDVGGIPGMYSFYVGGLEFNVEIDFNRDDDAKAFEEIVREQTGLIPVC